MKKTTASRGPAAQADRLVKAAFTQRAVQPVPEHLINLADELEAAALAGRLNRSSQAA
jgi:hypothetical protein